MRGLDLTGQRSGKLTALYRLDEKRRGNYLWLAQCDCGNYVKVIASDFAAGKSQSCGCARTGKHTKDLTGMQFGRLTAMERLPEKKGSSYLWLCQCSCGNTVKVRTAALLSGNTKSCGCLKRVHCQEMGKDIRNQKFGFLTPLYPTDRRVGGSVVWVCRCDCGKLCDVSYNALMSGNTKSCGCLKEQHEAPPAFDWKTMTAETYGRRSLRADNTSGYTGVQKTKRGKWHAYITVEKKTYHLGTYADLQDAVQARQEAEEALLQEPDPAKRIALFQKA